MVAISPLPSPPPKRPSSCHGHCVYRHFQPRTSTSSINSKDELLDHEQRLVNSGNAILASLLILVSEVRSLRFERSRRAGPIAALAMSISRLCRRCILTASARFRISTVHVRGQTLRIGFVLIHSPGDADDDRAGRSLHFRFQHRLMPRTKFLSFLRYLSFFSGAILAWSSPTVCFCSLFFGNWSASRLTY